MKAPLSHPEARAAAFLAAKSIDAPLTERLATYATAAAKLSPELYAAYDRFVSRISASASFQSAPLIGDTFPDGMFPDSDGRLVTLSALWQNGPLVISFNRGHWCPFCRLELCALADAYPAIAAAGGTVVSIQPDVEEFLERLVERDGLPYSVLSDLDLGFALSLGLVASIGVDMRETLRAVGVDLAKMQRNDGWLLPIPSTFVVAKDGMVVARHIDPDFRRRMTIEAILKAIAGDATA